jgi:hypothetical protein
VDWDDGDEENRVLVLGGRGAVPWRKSLHARDGILLRLCAKGKVELGYSNFMKAETISITTPSKDMCVLPPSPSVGECE